MILEECDADVDSLFEMLKEFLDTKIPKVENSCKHFLRAKASDYVLGATKHTLNVTEHIASKKIAKEGVDEAIKIEAKHIQKAIGKSGYTQVERILPNANDQKRLLEDIINKYNDKAKEEDRIDGYSILHQWHSK